MPEMAEAAAVKMPQSETEDESDNGKNSSSGRSNGGLSNNSTDVKFKQLSKTPHSGHSPGHKRRHSHQHPSEDEDEEEEQVPSVEMLLLQSSGLVLGWGLMFAFAKYGDIFTHIFE